MNEIPVKRITRWHNFKGFVRRHWASFAVGVGIGVGSTLIVQTIIESSNEDDNDIPDTDEEHTITLETHTHAD